VQSINKKTYFLINSAFEFNLTKSIISKKKITNYKLIATSKEAIKECIKNKKNFDYIESYTSNAELNKLGQENINLLSNLINHSDTFLLKEINKLEELKIYPFKFNQFKLKILIDTSSTKILFLKNFFEKTDVLENNIYIYENSEFTLHDNKGLFNEYANIYLLFIDQFKIDKKLLFKIGYFSHLPHSLYTSNLKNKKNSIYKKCKNFIKRVINHFNKKNRSFVIFDYGHDIKPLEQLFLQRKFKKFYSMEASNLQNYFYINLWKKIQIDEKFKNFFTFNNISYFVVVKNIIKIFIEDDIPRSLITYQKNLNAIKNSNIKFALTGSINVGLVTRSAMLALQKKKIPIITYTEGGGYGQFISPHHHSEFSDGDILLCYGPGNENYIKSLNLNTNKKIVPVGSINIRKFFDNFKNDNTPEKINSIMFVTTIIKENSVVVPFNGPAPGSSLMAQLKVIKYLYSIKSKININIKPHPYDTILKKILKQHEFSDLKIISGKLEDNLKNIDLIILDFPSTTLLEAISTKSHVFLLNLNCAFKFTKEQKRLLDKRVHLFDDFSEMKREIDSLIQKNKFDLIKEDNNFLSSYGFKDTQIDQTNHVFDEIIKLINKNNIKYLN